MANNVTQALDVSGFADETALTGGTNTASLTKTGDGTLTLTGANAFSGNLTASAGRLNVNGALTNNAFVQAGGTLGGNGTVVNLTNNGGTVAPGNSIDTLNVTGDFTQDASGTLEIEFDNTGIDLIDVTGTANLDGTLNLTELATGVTLDTPLTFLETDDGIDGEFNTVNRVFLSGTTLTDAVLDIGPKVATVTFSGFTAAFEEQGNTGTGRGAGGALDDLAVSDPTASLPIINAINNSPNVASALNSQGNAVANGAAVEANTALNLVSGVAHSRVSGVDAIARRDAAAAT